MGREERNILEPFAKVLILLSVWYMHSNLSSHGPGGRGRRVFAIQGCRAARGMSTCPTERFFLFCQAVRDGIVNQFAGSFDADLF
jgi:hypothetical protein